MLSRRRIVTRLAAGSAVLGLAGLPVVMPSATAAASAVSQTSALSRAGVAECLQEITGSGSSWAQNAVDEWIGNVQQQGLQVVFTGNGSAEGRQNFAESTVDFAVSDVGYQGNNSEDGDDTSSRPYAYLPITAGGTAFPYNITVAGKRITNLRLSGKVLAEIFTLQITNWDNPQITADNNGHALPSIPIITVVPSEGSGTTAMFTQYLSYEFRSLWTPFNDGDSGWTEFWPPDKGPSQVAQDGSPQVMNYIASKAAQGAIGIDEYSYPLAAGFPVVQMENAAGYYVLPTEYNDAVALTQAKLNMNKNSIDYLLQNLDDVYGYSDPRTYPLSSYSYTIMPASKTDTRMEVPAGQCPAKWQTLANFLDYSICRGQGYIGPIGYSALPVNLVEDGFAQIHKIKAAAPKVSIDQLNVGNCNNPTFIAGHPDENYLAKIAPYPPACDKQGQGPCTGTLNGNANGGKGSATPVSSGSPSPGASSSASASASPSTSGDSGGGSAGGGTGQLTGVTGSGQVNPTAVSLPAGQSGVNDDVLYALAALLLLGVLAAPPLFAWLWSGARKRQL
jgi:phosphate transport system substrate-binding protein